MSNDTRTTFSLSVASRFRGEDEIQRDHQEMIQWMSRKLETNIQARSGMALFTQSQPNSNAKKVESGPQPNHLIFRTAHTTVVMYTSSPLVSPLLLSTTRPRRPKSLYSAHQTLPTQYFCTRTRETAACAHLLLHSLVKAHFHPPTFVVPARFVVGHCSGHTPQTSKE